MKKTQEQLFFLRRLRSFRVSQSLLVKFYRAVIESVLTLSFTVWYGYATVDDWKRLHRIVVTASKIIGSSLPLLDDLYQSRVLKKSFEIIHDEHHSAHNLFQLTRSADRYRSIKSGSNRTLNTFYPTAIRTIKWLGWALFRTILFLGAIYPLSFILFL